MFGVSVETIKRRTADGTLKPTYLNCRVLQYSAEDVTALVQTGYCPKAELRAFAPMVATEVEGRFGLPRNNGVSPLLRPAPAQSPPAAEALADLAVELLCAAVSWGMKKPEYRPRILAAVDSSRNDG